MTNPSTIQAEISSDATVRVVERIARLDMDTAVSRAISSDMHELIDMPDADSAGDVVHSALIGLLES